VAFVRNSSGEVTNILYRGINAPRLNPPESTPTRLAAFVGDYWSEELRKANRLEIHDGKLAYHDHEGTWLHFLPFSADHFDAEAGRISLEFTRNPAGEVTGVKLSGSRIRHLRYTRVTLPRGGG
jgi:hypothetical protein